MRSMCAERARISCPESECVPSSMSLGFRGVRTLCLWLFPRVTRHRRLNSGANVSRKHYDIQLGTGQMLPGSRSSNLTGISSNELRYGNHCPSDTVTKRSPIQESSDKPRAILLNEFSNRMEFGNFHEDGLCCRNSVLGDNFESGVIIFTPSWTDSGLYCLRERVIDT